MCSITATSDNLWCFVKDYCNNMDRLVWWVLANVLHLGFSRIYLSRQSMVPGHQNYMNNRRKMLNILVSVIRLYKPLNVTSDWVHRLGKYESIDDIKFITIVGLVLAIEMCVAIASTIVRYPLFSSPRPTHMMPRKMWTGFCWALHSSNFLHRHRCNLNLPCVMSVKSFGTKLWKIEHHMHTSGCLLDDMIYIITKFVSYL